MPAKPRKRKLNADGTPLRDPSGTGRRTVPIGFWPDDEAAVNRILSRMRDGAKFAHAVRLAVIEYDRLCAAGRAD